MIRTQTPHGWLLVTHTDHAHLAAAIAREWGNAQFRRPEPRTSLLTAIQRHEDAMHQQDGTPVLAEDHSPLALTPETFGHRQLLQGSRLGRNLSSRTEAVRMVAADDPYAALLIALQTELDLTSLADRSALTPAQNSLLDRFLAEEVRFREQLRSEVDEDPFVAVREKSDRWLQENFALFQAWDFLATYLCLGLEMPTELPQPLPLVTGETVRVRLVPLGLRHVQLDPWPLAKPNLRLEFAARPIIGHKFTSQQTLSDAWSVAREEQIGVRLTAAL